MTKGDAVTASPSVPGRATLSTEEAAKLLGVARHTLWRAARSDGGILKHGVLVVTPIKVGQRALRWPVVPLMRLLELDADALTRP